ncbi:hypothetical protein BWQ96_03946 [Gracilariopsis chorda]|uniref:Small ribosomal subunit protein mS38 n=1 Tax=Gracilariopsis chorda TaxID=448386 RepID=A0A2V3IYT0_9FLOR|nr:hypothetical protein BWQ96_03946 [Gracilariopsis chorda]|eukprot:PXF46290.1 hypothetical protein BWQ96_03946 [Gracilariopsis chorda]
MIRRALYAAKDLAGPIGSSVQRASFASGHALHRSRNRFRSDDFVMGPPFLQELPLLAAMSHMKNYASPFVSQDTNMSESNLLQRNSTPVTLDQALKEHHRGLLSVLEPEPHSQEDDGLQASSTLKKRRLKMNRHKYRKRRKRDRRRSK